MRQLNINGPLYVGGFSFYTLNKKHFRFLGIHVILSVLKWIFCTFLTWRGHEGDSSSHEQTVLWRAGGVRVPLHALHWLSLGFGGGCGWREEHQHLFYLKNSSTRSRIHLQLNLQRDVWSWMSLAPPQITKKPRELLKCTLWCGSSLN